jgi:MraZ protein
MYICYEIKKHPVIKILHIGIDAVLKVVHNGFTSLKRVKSGGWGGGIVADEEKGMQPETSAAQAPDAENQSIQAGNSLPSSPEDAFFGSYDHAIDGKGRIIIPSDYRDALGKLFTIGPTRDMKAIALYPQRVWLQVLTELTEHKKLHGGKPKVQLYLNRFFKFSYPKAESDNQGRLLLPAKLRQEMLGEARDVEISGALDHIRIIDSGKAAAEDQFYKENEQDILEYIGGLEG